MKSQDQMMKGIIIISILRRSKRRKENRKRKKMVMSKSINQCSLKRVTLQKS